jgi:localization factor PodJL
MLRPLAVTALALFTLTSPALAGYSEGVAAFGAGRHDIAAREFLAAAQAGDRESAYMLGRLYALGSGVPQDWVQAWMWHDRAARQGHEEAAVARASLESIMGPDQLARVRAAATPPVPAYRTGAYEVAPAAPPPPAAAEPRSRVTVGLDGVTAAVPMTPESNGPRPVSLRANGPTFEGLLGAQGSLPDQTRLIQRRLNQEGYHAGPIDGLIGPLTRQAIRSYEGDQGWPATGRLTTALVDRLAAEPPETVVRVEVVEQQTRAP